jgi:hypothetical protein
MVEDRGAAAPEHLPLARATLLAHKRLFPDESVKDMKTLDLIALALSTLTPLYERDDTGLLRAVSEAELAAGRFTRGGTRLEIPGRPPLRFLVVARAALDEAIEKLASDALAAARLGLNLRQGARADRYS